MRLLIAVVFLCASTAQAGLLRYDLIAGDTTDQGWGSFKGTGYMIFEESLIVPGANLLESFALKDFFFEWTNGTYRAIEKFGIAGFIGGDFDENILTMDDSLSIDEWDFCATITGNCGPFGTGFITKGSGDEGYWAGSNIFDPDGDLIGPGTGTGTARWSGPVRVPEPGTIALLLFGLAAISRARRYPRSRTSTAG